MDKSLNLARDSDSENKSISGSGNIVVTPRSHRKTFKLSPEEKVKANATDQAAAALAQHPEFLPDTLYKGLADEAKNVRHGPKRPQNVAEPSPIHPEHIWIPVAEYLAKIEKQEHYLGHKIDDATIASIIQSITPDTNSITFGNGDGLGDKSDGRAIKCVQWILPKLLPPLKQIVGSFCVPKITLIDFAMSTLEVCDILVSLRLSDDWHLDLLNCFADPGIVIRHPSNPFEVRVGLPLTPDMVLDIGQIRYKTEYHAGRTLLAQIPQPTVLPPGYMEKMTNFVETLVVKEHYNAVLDIVKGLMVFITQPGYEKIQEKGLSKVDWSRLNVVAIKMLEFLVFIVERAEKGNPVVLTTDTQLNFTIPLHSHKCSLIRSYYEKSAPKVRVCECKEISLKWQ